jgi:hypothetical protein
MAAFFIRKSDNLHYLRLTGNTKTVKFAAAKEAVNFYRFDILRPVGVGGSISIGASTTAGIATFHTESAVPIPTGSTLKSNNDVFTNVEISFEFESGPTTRDYQILGYGNNIEYTYNQDIAINKSVGCTHYFNNGANIKSDVGLATTVAGKFDTTDFTSNIISTSAGEYNIGNLAIQLSNNIDNGIAGIEPLNRAREEHPSCNGSVSQMYGIGNTTFVSQNAGPAKSYRCWFTTPFPNTNYNVSITGLDVAPYGAAGSGEVPGRIRYVCTVDKKPEYVVYNIDSYYIEEGVVTITGGIGFIRYHEVRAESVVESKRLTLGGEIVSTNSGFSTSYPGFKKFTGLFAKQSGTWKSPPTTHIKQSGEWKIPTEISIKHNGAWERVFPPNAYSNWINMLENFDDAVDFSVQVHALD